MKKHRWVIEFETKPELEKVQPNMAELQAEVKDELENFFPFYNIKVTEEIEK